MGKKIDKIYCMWRIWNICSVSRMGREDWGTAGGEIRSFRATNKKRGKGNHQKGYFGLKVAIEWKHNILELRKNNHLNIGEI